jgi:hypothetical protein
MIVHRALTPVVPAAMPATLYRSEPRSVLGVRVLLAWFRQHFG